VSGDSVVLRCKAGELGRINGQDKMFLQELTHSVTAVPVYVRKSEKYYFSENLSSLNTMA
jgi:hypothetical protein